MYAPTYLYMLTQHYFFLCSKHSLPRVRRIMLGIRNESSPHKEGDTLFNARATFFFVQQKILAKKASTTCRPRIQAWLLNNYCSLDCCTYIQVCDAPKKNAGQKKGRGCLQTKCRGNSCHAFFGKANSTVRGRFELRTIWVEKNKNRLSSSTCGEELRKIFKISKVSKNFVKKLQRKSPILSDLSF